MAHTQEVDTASFWIYGGEDIPHLAGCAAVTARTLTVFFNSTLHPRYQYVGWLWVTATNGGLPDFCWLKLFGLFTSTSTA